jgi:predicted pyridoxine 5'-phosphate oxidase superfamily flavin-nucleotide-binding protein
MLRYAVGPTPFPAASWATLVGIVVLMAGLTIIISARKLFTRTGQSPAPWKPTPELIFPLLRESPPTPNGAAERLHEGRHTTGILTSDMKRVVAEQRLGFVATVCPDGTPNLSPKGTTSVWDDDHLVFANIRSPGTLANLRQNASVEVNVVDPFVRKGYRFKGVASILESGALYDKVLAFYRERSSRSAIHEIVMIRVQTVQPLDSPAYDLGLTEDEVRDRWERYFQSIRAGQSTSETGE